MTQPKSDLPQGTPDLLILKIVALCPVHGYAIAQRLQQVSRDAVQVPLGSLYPALHRLENRGLLAADWKETETGREAKVYKLTRKGRAEFESESAKLAASGPSRCPDFKLEGSRRMTRASTADPRRHRQGFENLRSSADRTSLASNGRDQSTVSRQELHS